LQKYLVWKMNTRSSKTKVKEEKTLAKMSKIEEKENAPLKALAKKPKIEEKENKIDNIKIISKVKMEPDLSEKIKDEASKDKFLEKGHIYFFYRPKVSLEKVSSFDDIARLYLLMKPIHQNDSHFPTNDKASLNPKSRLLMIPKKKLPHKSEKYFGFVWKTAENMDELVNALKKEEYDTVTKGHRVIESARPCGEGVYGITEHGNHTHLAYVLELPHETTNVQKTLNIHRTGSFVVSVKNPFKAGPTWAPG
jgi:hypothetical protein